jgi:hypothetical protein
MKQKTKERRLLWEAAAILGFVRVALRFLPSERIFVWASRRPARINRFALDEIEWVAWAVDTISTTRWMKASDLPRALAAQTMLSRRGIVSSLCLGVARAGKDLAAYAWLERESKVILDHAPGPKVVQVARFGGETA